MKIQKVQKESDNKDNKKKKGFGDNLEQVQYERSPI